jgi:GNAT superfamily N-acetyltransferase
MGEGATYAFPENQTLEEPRPWWMEQPPGQTVVAVSEGVIAGSAKMGPNRPGRGSHVATASFLVDPRRQGQGTGRVLGVYVLDWCRSYRSGRNARQAESRDPESSSAVRACSSVRAAAA